MFNDNSPPTQISAGQALPQFMFECAVVFHTLERGEGMIGISPERLLEDVGLDALVQLARAVERSGEVLERTEERLATVRGVVFSALQIAAPPPPEGEG